MNSRGAAGIAKEMATSEGTRPQLEGPSHEEIQQRAYRIHLERGGAHGQDLDGWRRAELESQEKYRMG
jgi:hypothetical protein